MFEVLKLKSLEMKSSSEAPSGTVGELYSRRSIVSNIVYILINQVMSKCISLLTVTLIIRLLGPHSFGDYSFALAVIGYGGILVNFGLSTYGSRQINQAESREQVAEVVSDVLSLRLVFAVFTFVPLLIVPLFFDIEYLTAFLVLNVINIAEALSLEWYFKGSLKNRLIVVATFIQKISHLGAVLLFYGLFDLTLACVSMAFSFVVFSGMQILIFRKYEKIKFKLTLHSFPVFKKIVFVTWPFFFSGLFSLIISNTDTIFLKIYTDSTSVGYYSTAHTVTDFFSNIRYAIIGVIFPVFAQTYFISPDKLLRKYSYIFKIIMVSISVLAVIVSIYSATIIEFLFGAMYSPSSEILKYLVFLSVVLYVHTFISAIYNAIGWEKKVFVSGFVAALLNIILNSFWVAKYNVMGAIAATLVSLITATVLLALSYPKAVSFIRSQGDGKAGR